MYLPKKRIVDLNRASRRRVRADNPSAGAKRVSQDADPRPGYENGGSLASERSFHRRIGDPMRAIHVNSSFLFLFFFFDKAPI